MAFANGLKGFIACTLLAVILNFVIGIDLGALLRLIRVMDVPTGSTFDNFYIIQQASWLIGWIPILIFAVGAVWLIASIFNKEPGGRY